MNKLSYLSWQQQSSKTVYLPNSKITLCLHSYTHVNLKKHFRPAVSTPAPAPASTKSDALIPILLKKTCAKLAKS